MATFAAHSLPGERTDLESQSENEAYTPYTIGKYALLRSLPVHWELMSVGAVRG